MIYISKKDSKIKYSISPLDENEYFECDELIAPAISSFNKKGYVTAFCCSGHVVPHEADSNGVYVTNELYVAFKKINPNKNLLKLLRDNKIVEGFTIINEKINPDILFSIRYEFGKNIQQFTGDTKQVAELYKELLDVNQKLFEVARKIPHKRQLNKSFRRG